MKAKTKKYKVWRTYTMKSFIYIEAASKSQAIFQVVNRVDLDMNEFVTKSTRWKASVRI